VTFSQDIDKETIKRSNNYYWGEAETFIEQEASDIALSNLTKQIAVTIKSEFERNIIETEKGVEETAQNIISTYSGATLRNVKTITAQKDEKIEVFHYISKNEVVNLFNEREKLICNIFKKAEDYQKENNIGYALKQYYFCLILMNSIPSTTINFEGMNLITEIPSRINNIIANTKFILKESRKNSDIEKELIFAISAFDKPVQMIEFSFWDGSNQVQVSGGDGEGIFRLYGASVNFSELKIDIKYSFYESREEIKEVAELWNLVKNPYFRSDKQINLNYIPVEQVNLEKETRKKESIDILKEIAQGKFKLNIENKDLCPVTEKIGTETLLLLELLEKKDLNGIGKLFGGDKFLVDKIDKVLKYNSPMIIGDKFDVRISKTEFGWELRRIKMLNKYATLKKQTTEYLIIDFTEDGTLYDLNFGIIDDLYEKFVEQAQYGNDWGNRLQIIKFVEKYRTAFLCRDTEVLDSLFADEALIIVGRVLKKTKLPEIKYKQLSGYEPDVKYIRFTKNEYLKNLKRIFNANPDIFLGFSTFNIARKNNQEGVYGISMRQDYHSSSYADEGYLFLLIDFYEKNPQIYVRAWQPSEWDDSSLIKLSNFNINR